MMAAGRWGDCAVGRAVWGVGGSCVVVGCGRIGCVSVVDLVCLVCGWCVHDCCVNVQGMGG